jgi:hypothetical protein
MMNFLPIPGAPYKHDYIDIFKTIANSAGRVPEIPTYKELCKNDLFFLLFFGLGREDINNEPKGIDKGFLISMIREVEEDHDSTLDLYAREHYKSSVITYGLPIQELIKNPEERIGIFSCTRPLAKDFLRQIKLTLEDNVPIKKWFPDVFYTKPKSMAPKWALAINTPVMTTVGWKNHGDLITGDKIFGSQGQVITVIGNSGPMYDASCRRIVFDDCELVASSEHLWPVQCKKGVRWDKYEIRILQTDQLPIKNKYRRMLSTPSVESPEQKIIKRHIDGRYVRKIEEIPTVPVNCIKVDAPDHLYLAGTSLVPTHNSEDDGLYVKRKSHAREASIEAWGIIDGMPTGKHYTIRIYDDLVVDTGVTTPEMIQKVANAYELSQSLGTDGGTKRLAGTHYHFADLYTVLRKRPGYKVRIKTATDDGTPTGRPVFLSQKRLDELLAEQGQYIFSCQQLLSPVAAGDQKFKIEWLKYYDTLPEKLNVYMLCDPANEKQKKNDFTTLCAIGIDQYENLFLLQIIRDKLNLDERWVALRDMYVGLTKQGYRPQNVGYEKYGKDSDIFYLQKCQGKEGIYFTILDLGGRTGRIMGMVPSFEKGLFWLPRRFFYTPVYCNTPGMEGKPVDMVKVFIDEEYYPAPYCVHDDMFDCISRINDAKLGVTAPMISQSNMMPGGGSMTVADLGQSGWMAG